MTNHPTGRELLDAQFEICSNAQADAITTHVAECTECRGRANTLKHKFEALDLLRVNVSASDQFVAETLRQIRNPPAAERSLFPQFAWLAGAAAAAAVVIAIVYTGPMATVEQPAAPVMQIAMQVEETKEAAPAPEMDDMAQEAPPPSETRLAAAAAPMMSKGMMAGRSARSLEESRREMAYYAESDGPAKSIPPPANIPGGWSATPKGVDVQVFPALIEFDNAVRNMKKDSGLRAEQCAISVSNSSAGEVTATLTRAFASTNWSVNIADKTVQISTQEPACVRLTIELPAFKTKTFHCTTILPAETAEGDKP